MQVKELEAHVGLPLFDRSGRQVALTTAGEYMLVYARRMLATLKDAEDAAARLKGVEAAREVLHYFAPVGEKDVYVDRAMVHLQAALATAPASTATA